MKKYSIETVVGILWSRSPVCGIHDGETRQVSVRRSIHSLYARFATVSGLRVGNLIEIGGIEVGRVERLNIDQENQMSVVELKIRKDIKVYDDASASIRTAGLIGDKFVEIELGSGSSEARRVYHRDNVAGRYRGPNQ
jgi:phospholipid/cholesterol/gamma-HCH transport system substrate-binding protein